MFVSPTTHKQFQDHASAQALEFRRLTGQG
jgi:hypothetical protein